MKEKLEIIRRIKEAIEEVSLGACTADTIKSEDKLIDDLGLDSLDYATVMLQLEEWLGIEIKEDEVNWSRIQTLDELACLFEEYQVL